MDDKFQDICWGHPLFPVKAEVTAVWRAGMTSLGSTLPSVCRPLFRARLPDAHGDAMVGQAVSV